MVEPLSAKELHAEYGQLLRYYLSWRKSCLLDIRGDGRASIRFWQDVVEHHVPFHRVPGAAFSRFLKSDLLAPRPQKSNTLSVWHHSGLTTRSRCQSLGSI